MFPPKILMWTEMTVYLLSLSNRNSRRNFWVFDKNKKKRRRNLSLANI